MLQVRQAMETICHQFHRRNIHTTTDYTTTQQIDRTTYTTVPLHHNRNAGTSLERKSQTKWVFQLSSSMVLLSILENVDGGPWI